MNGGKQRTYYVLGADGFIGSYIYQTLIAQGKTVVGTCYPNPVAGLVAFDMTQPASCQALLHTCTENDIVIHTAAQANVELCENDSSTDVVNIQGVQNVVNALPSPGIRYLFFSSEYVFDGQSGPYDEAAAPHPINRYGQQKLAAEQYIAAHCSNYCIVRTTTVYGHEAAGKNFFMSLRARLQRDETVPVPHDQISTPTLVDDVARLTAEVADTAYTGILNIVGPDRLSRYEFASRIADKFQLPTQHLVSVATTTLHQAAARPLQAGLTITKLLTLTAIPPRSVDEALTFLYDQSR